MNYFYGDINKIKVNDIKYSRIIIASPSRYPFGHANSVNVLRMAESFSDKGLNVHLIAFRSMFSRKKNIIRETVLRYGSNYSFDKIFIYWPFDRFLNPVVGFIFFLFSLFYSRNTTLLVTRSNYAAFIGSLMGFDTVYESHSPPLTRTKKFIEKKLGGEKTVLFVLISKGLLKKYSEFSLLPESYIILPSGGRELFKENSDNNFYGEAKNICYIGSLYKGRGFGLIYKISLKMPEKIFHVFGDTESLDLSKFKKMPKNLILYGSLTPFQAELLPRNFDILLMPYQNNVYLANKLDTTDWMSPMKMFEYMFSKKPIISSDIEVLKEVLIHKKNSLLVEAENVDEWCNTIIKLDDPDLRSYLSKNAFETVSQNFTWEKRVEKILKEIQLKNIR